MKPARLALLVTLTGLAVIGLGGLVLLFVAMKGLGE